MILLVPDAEASCVPIGEVLADGDILDEKVDANDKESIAEADSVREADTDDNDEKEIILVALTIGDNEDNEDTVFDAVDTGEFVMSWIAVRDINDDDVTIALFENNPLIVESIDTDGDKEGFEAVAMFVAAEEGDTEELADEVKESTECVGAADIDDAIVFEDVFVAGNMVKDTIDVELAEFVFNSVAKDETVFKLETDGNAVPDVEAVFKWDTVGWFVPLAVLVTVEVIEGNDEEEALIVTVSNTVNVWEDNTETLTAGVTVSATVGETVAVGTVETEFICVDCGEILFNDVNVITEDTVGEDNTLTVVLNDDKEVDVWLTGAVTDALKLENCVKLEEIVLPDGVA